MAALPLSRRHLLRLAALSGPALLAGCRRPPHRLLVSRGDFPAAWAARLPDGWNQQVWDDPASLLQNLPATTGSSAALVQLWDGWAGSLPPSRWDPFAPGELPGGLLAPAAPVSRLFLPAGSPSRAFPWAVDPWVLLLRDRPDLARRASEGWELLLDPSLQGRLVLPSSPRVSITLVGADPQRLRLLRRAAGLGHGLPVYDAVKVQAGPDTQRLGLHRGEAVPFILVRSGAVGRHAPLHPKRAPVGL